MRLVAMLLERSLHVDVYHELSDYIYIALQCGVLLIIPGKGDSDMNEQSPMENTP